MRYPLSLVSIPLPPSHTTYRASNHLPPPSSVHRMIHRTRSARRPSLWPFRRTGIATMGLRSALLFSGRQGRRRRGRADCVTRSTMKHIGSGNAASPLVPHCTTSNVTLVPSEQTGMSGREEAAITYTNTHGHATPATTTASPPTTYKVLQSLRCRKGSQKNYQFEF